MLLLRGKGTTAGKQQLQTLRLGARAPTHTNTGIRSGHSLARSLFLPPRTRSARVDAARVCGGEGSAAAASSIGCHSLSKATVTKTQASAARTQRSSVAGEVTLSLSLPLSLPLSFSFHPLRAHSHRQHNLHRAHKRRQQPFICTYSHLRVTNNIVRQITDEIDR